MRKKFANNFLIGISSKLLLLIVFLLLIFTFTSSEKKDLVVAFADKLTLLPGSFENLSQGEYTWAKLENVFIHDLSEDADSEQFNLTNSSFIINKDQATNQPDLFVPDITPKPEEVIVEGIDNQSEEATLPEIETPSGNVQSDSSASLPSEDNVGDVADSESNLPEISDPAPQDEPVIEILPVVPETIPSDEPVIEAPTPQTSTETIPTPPSEPAPEQTSTSEPASESGDVSFLKHLKDYFLSYLNSGTARAQADASLDFVEPSVSQTRFVLSDFSVPLDYTDSYLQEATLNLSMTNLPENQGEVLIEYFVTDSWRELASLDLGEPFSNASHGGYFSYLLSSLPSAEAIENLKIRFTKFDPDEANQEKFYLDSVWLEVLLADDSTGAMPQTQVQGLAKIQASYNLEQISEQNDFEADTNPEFKFHLKKEHQGILNKIGAGIASIFNDEFKDAEINVQVFDSEDQRSDEEVIVNYLSNGEFEVKLKHENSASFKPGVYRIVITVENQGEFFQTSLDFSWGVLAYNSNKSWYKFGETAYLQMAVLDEKGHTLCDADVSLDITSPVGNIYHLSTLGGEIIRNPLCGPDNVIDSPDYYAYLDLDEVGAYTVKASAETTNGLKSIEDSFEVQKYIPVSIERVGPTRIYPVADYDMLARIRLQEDFTGSITETLPASFILRDYKIYINNDEISKKQTELQKELSGDQQILIFKNLSGVPGDVIEITYTFDAPNISPEFYLLGPLKMINSDVGSTIFEEFRKWQIASDQVDTFDYNSGSSNGWTNAGYAWDSINNQYASRDIPRRSADDSANYIQSAFSGVVPSYSYTINTVEIGIEAYAETNEVTAYVIPYYNGTPGTANTVSGAALGTTDDNGIDWFDITSASVDTWSELQTLGIRVYGLNTSNSQSRFLYVDQLYLRVDYTIPNDPPTGTFNSAAEKTNASGIVDISIEVDDPDDNDTSARIDYVAGAACNFGTPLDPTLSEVDGDTTADYDDPNVNNANTYQIGNATGWITTASGSNTVDFDWDTKATPGMSSADGIYCLRLTTNDGTENQTTPDTQTITIDNANPSTPGSLADYAVGGTWVRLTFGSASTDSHFDQYKIYYAEGASGVTLSDSPHTDSNLATSSYFGATSTLVTGLFPETQYVFNIWAFDQFGNIATATVEVSTTTLAQLVPPISSFNSAAQKTDGSGVVDLSIEVDDGNDDPTRVKVDYEAGGTCQFLSSGDPSLDETPANISADFGTVIIDNDSDYQVGTSTGWIETVSGSNSVLFDWITTPDLSSAEGLYCLRLVANDGGSDQTTPATTTLVIDNVAPTDLDSLTFSTSTDSTITLNLGDEATEAYFSQYKVFYKKAQSGVTEADSEFLHADLLAQDYNSATYITIENLEPNSTYAFNIWAYDLYGNKTSATEVTGDTLPARPLRANSVMFWAGTYSGDGTTGKNSDTDQTFSSFNFKLAESGVEIKNAYIIFDARYESYNDNAGNYTGYNLAFDACSGACTPNAFSGTSRVLKDDNTVLSYDEGESNRVRLLMDVTSEAQLAAYTGSGTMKGQVGYRIERSSAVNSISYATARLVINYVYNQDDVDSFTNTVFYPLDSTNTGDTGTRRAVQAANCTLDSNCPTFAYTFTAPDFSQSLSQWFTADYHAFDNNQNRTDDVSVDVNIESQDINSATLVHENALAGTQDTAATLYFGSVYGFTRNTSDALEIRLTSGNNTIYLLGGEVAETYIASTTAATRTKTVVFPMGVVNNGNSTSQFNDYVDVYFPENGKSSGVVNVESAWFRIKSSNYNFAAGNVTVASKVGDNVQSGNAVYNYNPGATVVDPTFNIYHIISSSDYSELELANKEIAKRITLYTTNSTVNQGGVSAELVITYTYTDDANGYLSNLNLFAGQTDTAGNSQSETKTIANLVAPELAGTKSTLAADFLASYLFSDSTTAMPGGNILLDANIATSSPTCTNAYYTSSDSTNAFADFFKDVSSILEPINNRSYTACYSNNGGGSGTTGAKMNASLRYSYGYSYALPSLTQNDWRWYENTDSVLPVTPWADENATATDVYITDPIRLRINIAVADRILATSSEAFKLQFGIGVDCSAVSDWADVGQLASNTAWIGYDNTPADGASASSTLLASSTVAETYEETNNSTYVNYSVPDGGQAEWDWVIYNNSATSSAAYCFRMVKEDGTLLDNYNVDGYPKIITAPDNTAPSSASSLGQYRDNEITVIPNQTWINENSVKLRAAATDPDTNEVITLYFQFIPNLSSFMTATSEPVGACAYGTAYGSCATNIWYVATSALDFFRTDPYIGTTSITAIPDSSSGYKWQVLACDLDGACSAWVKPGANPNFRVDTTPPLAPGNLTWNSSSATGITVNFGASSTESNFSHYRIYYKQGVAGVTELDNLLVDPNLNFQNYNNKATTTINSLSAGTPYVFNIWAYDLAGNKASATVELATSTTSSFTPPTGTIESISQKTDGSGAIDIAMLVDDDDNDDTLRVKVEYVASSTCDFALPLDPTIDPVDISATYGTPVVDNNLAYQIGSSTGWIQTSPGANYVLFDWLSKNEVPSANSTYCIRTTVSDGVFDQATPDTVLILIDNLAPTAPGALGYISKTTSSVVLSFGSQGYDTRFSHYKIFYSTSTPPTVNDIEHVDANLSTVNYSGATTTLVTGLAPGTDYYFNIWAYDLRGNKASSTILNVRTNYIPNNVNAIEQYRSDEITTIANGSWVNDDKVRLVASANDLDTAEIVTLYFEFLPTAGTFTTATSQPSGACAYGTAYGSCGSNIWFVASSSVDDYSVNPYQATTSITAIPDSAAGYKWQVLACDDEGACANDWVAYNAVTPNMKIDATPPTPPGNLSEYTRTSGSITLSYGATTTEANFVGYKIFYASSSPVSESSTEYDVSDLDYINYNGQSQTTLSGLLPDTTYYFKIWAYDEAGNSASSSEVAIATDTVNSTPGVIFYTRNTRVLYYQVWTGSSWSAEQTGPTLGSAAGDNIRHIRTVASDDGGKIGILAKTWDGANQEWWGTVYRYAADDFVNTSQLGSGYASIDNNQIITGCLAPLSGGEFFVVRNNNGSAGTNIYSWDASSGWTTESAGPDPGEVVNGCKLVRRPGTDNYILITFDDYNGTGANDGNVGTAYYYGGSTYADSWTTWTEHSVREEDLDNFIGDAFFDPSNNTRGAINYSNSISTGDTIAKKFVCDDTSINYGVAATSPTTWTNDFVHGEFAVNPASVGIAYYAGRDLGGELNVFSVDATSSTPLWGTPANSDNISAGALYSETNDSQKPFAISFYKDDAGIVLWNEATALVPKYRIIDASTNALDASNSNVPGSDANVWTRVRLYNDPNENESLAIYQNDDIDYSAVFVDGLNDRFYNTADNPGSAQVWTELVTGSGAADADDEATTFAFTKRNSAPTSPTNLGQFRSDEVTAIANQGWSTESSVHFSATTYDLDTSEIVKFYLQLIPVASTSVVSTVEPASFCTLGTAYTACASPKIWQLASSTLGDYSVTPLVGTTTITGIPDTSTGYKWQVLACDDEARCSSWSKFNLTTPNFKVDTIKPTAPGALVVNLKTSTSIMFDFGGQSSDLNFDRYKIFYSSSSPVTIYDAQHSDANLLSVNYGGASDTTIYNLGSSTTYYINIWAYDLAGNSASSTMVSTTTSQSYYLTQTSYLLENDDGATVNTNTADAAIDTPLSNINLGERINARFQMDNTGGDVATGKVYKLQFENQTDAAGTWIDVGAATPISYSSALSGASGADILTDKASLNSNSFIFGKYYQDSAQTGSFTMYKNEFTEFVFAVETSHASPGKAYRLRLYNQTDAKALNQYDAYPTINTIAAEVRKYSKEAVVSPGATPVDLEYYLDPEGYADILVDDGARDIATATPNNYPVYNLDTKNTNSSDAIAITWNGQSDTAASISPIYLQIYHYGATNAWVTLASSTTASAGADFTMSASINSKLSEYYNSNWTFVRVYQTATTSDIALKSDYFNVVYSAATPNVGQLHYRFRNDDNDEANATWRELEDTGDPLTGTEIGVGENIRLRFYVANTGGGSASNYLYKLEYATTLGDCLVDTGAWEAVPASASAGEHFEMATSTYFGNGTSTTAQLANAESYNFVSGYMVEYPKSTSSAVTLIEDDYTEIEYVFKSTIDSVEAGTYCLRVTDNGSPIEEYPIYPTLTLAGSSNLAPFFTVDPIDNGSATNTPTSYGSNVTFTATADDPQSDDYYLAICKTPSITSGNNAPPNCTGGNWCISTLASSTAEASCNYSAATSTESVDWYAYACDKYPGVAVAKCSPYSQGSDTASNNSPFVVNHPPVFVSASTTDDNKDPGNTFTIGAIASDTDTLRGGDDIYMYACYTDSAGFAGCTGGPADTLCSVSTSSPNPYCAYNDTAPTLSGDYTYYVYVYDDVGLGASNNSISNTYTVNNTVPVLGTLILNGNNPISLNIKGAGDTNITTVMGSISDQNGCDNGLVSATAVIYMSGATGGYNCTQKSNDCYRIAVANCAKSGCTGDDDYDAAFTCDADMKYYAVPTDNSTNNPWVTENWLSYFNVYDGDNYTATTSAGVELITTLALEVTENDIDFGSDLFVGDDTGNWNATTTIINAGNSPIDTGVLGTNLSGNPSGTLLVTNIEYSLTPSFTWSSGVDLSIVPQTVNIIATNPISDSEFSDQIYWGIGIPFGQDASIYTGQNTFSVILDDDDWTLY